MKKVISLLKNPEEFLLATIELWQQGSDILTMKRGEEDYTVKINFQEGNADIRVRVLPNYYEFHVKPESSALLMAKPTIPDFVVGLSIANNHIKYHYVPKEKEARIWLNKTFTAPHGKTTRAEYLLSIASVCEMIWSALLPTMRVRQYGDVIEYSPRDDYKTFYDEWLEQMRAEYKQKHLLEGWDTVSLNEKQYMKMRLIAKDIEPLHDLEMAPLKRFCLVLYKGNKHLCFFYTKAGNRVNIIADCLEGGRDFTFTIKVEGNIMTLIRPEDERLLEMLQTRVTEDEITNWQWIAMNFFAINSFMLNYSDVSMDVEEKVCTAPSTKHQSKKQSRNTTRLFKCYTLKKNWVSRVNRKKTEITCPAWGVRGHFRHYKSGKVVFIEPFVKGKEKDKYKGKEYALLPYKDA